MISLKVCATRDGVAHCMPCFVLMRKKGKAYYTKFITMSEKYKKTS